MEVQGENEDRIKKENCGGGLTSHFVTGIFDNHHYIDNGKKRPDSGG